MEDEHELEKPSTNSFTPLQIWEKDRVEVTQQKYIERLTFSKLMKDIAKSFNFEKGLPATMLGLTIRPAQTICSYLDEGRYKVMNPVKYFLLIVGLTIFIGSMTGYYVLDKSQIKKELTEESEIKDAVVVNTEGIESASKRITFSGKDSMAVLSFVNDSAIKYRNIFGLISILVYSFFSFLFFKSSKFNLVEHLSINTFIYTHSSLWFLFLVLIGSNNLILLGVQAVLYLIMMFIVYNKLFRGSKKIVILKIFGVYICTSILSGVISFGAMFLYLKQSGELDEMFSALSQ